MAFYDLYHFDDLKNSAEELVIHELERQLTEADPEVDIPEDAILDMAAYALNMVKPMYRANLLGRVYTSAFEELYHEEIQKAVALAIQKISGNPPPLF